MSKNDLRALVWKEENWYVAKAVGLEVTSQGKTKSEAIKNLAEAVDLFLEDESFSLSNLIIPSHPELTAIYA